MDQAALSQSHYIDVFLSFYIYYGIVLIENLRSLVGGGLVPGFLQWVKK
jgi:hypothetical protein